MIIFTFKLYCILRYKEDNKYSFGEIAKIMDENEVVIRTYYEIAKEYYPYVEFWIEGG